MIIEGRFNGPPGSGNGGYCAGTFAAAAGMDAVSEVTLRRPPPLGVPMTVRPAGEAVEIWADELIAEVRPAADPVDAAVDPVPWDDAVAVSRTYLGFITHPFPTCYVCGPQRAQGDGLRLFPGRLAGGTRTAAPFLVPPAVSTELIWAALDCPGGWAVPLEGRPYVLGRLAARIVEPPQPGSRCVVMGEMTGEDGRKGFTVSSLYGPEGDLLATARGTWIAI